MEQLRKNHQRIISLKQAKKIIIFLILVFLFDFFLFPMPILASEFDNNIDISNNINVINNIKNLDQPVIINNLPKNDNWQVKKTGYYTMTAYNSEVAQCDDSPCITANGFNLCKHGVEDTVAANFLPFGAKVRIPELFGDKIFVVRDRMNVKYQNRLDVWMLEKQDAKQFGVKMAKIEILECP